VTELPGVRLTSVELLHLSLPLVTPFRTSYGTQAARDVLLVHVASPDAEGWGECVAMREPHYSSEYLDGAAHVLRHHLVPLVAAGPTVSADQVADRLDLVEGHRMAKAALEAAILDAQLRELGTSLAAHLGAVHDRVPAGVSIGIVDSIPRLLDAVEGYLAEGYRRVKLKIEPGRDVEPVRAVRERFGDELLLQVDANAAYTVDDWQHLRALDAFDLLLVEQPLAADDLLGHAELATRITTPICLDESIVSARSAATALALGACRIVNVKAGRVGGYLEARRIHDLCLDRGVPVWCGGMLETGIGRSANLALAALPGFTLPGDLSASTRYFEQDITHPLLLVDGHLTVPTDPGIGVDPLPEVLAEVVTHRELLTTG
jgi:o-succinylbenzoate synthase